jgi:hypothetical protein
VPESSPPSPSDESLQDNMRRAARKGKEKRGKVRGGTRWKERKRQQR